MSNRKDVSKIALDLMAFAAGQAVVFYTLKYFLNPSNTSSKGNVKSKSMQILDKLGRSNLTLNEYEGTYALYI